MSAYEEIKNKDIVTDLDLAVIFYGMDDPEDEDGNAAAQELLDLRAQARKLSALQAALSMSVQFLTNVNTITPEKTAEFIKALKDAGREDLADAVAVAGFASAFDMEEE